MAVDIKIDYDKCRFSMYDPTGCKKCIEKCPQAVLSVRPTQKRDFSLPKEQRFEPEHWKLYVSWEQYCTGCRACMDSCPTKAISVLIDGKPI